VLKTNTDATWCNQHFLDTHALRQADNARMQLARIMQRLNMMGLASRELMSKDYSPCIRKCLLSGFFMQVARRSRSGPYFTVKNNQEVFLHPSIRMDYKPEWIVFNKCFLTSKPYIETITAVTEKWLLEVAGNYYDFLKLSSRETTRLSVFPARKQH